MGRIQRDREGREIVNLSIHEASDPELRQLAKELELVVRVKPTAIESVMLATRHPRKRLHFLLSHN